LDIAVLVTHCFHWITTGNLYCLFKGENLSPGRASWKYNC